MEEGRVSMSDAGDDKDFLFSEIIPAYNVEKYIGEAIESIVNQDIGFTQNIQLILVDDGSTDATGTICDSYQERFPENVLVIHTDNQGASAARQAGLAQACGTYVNFLDGDDYWSSNAFRCAASFFSSHTNVRICAARHWFFGAKNQAHPLSYKFEADGVVDLAERFDCPQLSLSNAFVLRSLLSFDLFDNRLKIAEDFLVINKILLRELKYGVLAAPTYWYRKRAEGGSALDTQYVELVSFIAPLRLCHGELFAESVRVHGRVLPFLQYAVMYDLQWRIKALPAGMTMDGSFCQEYRETISGLLGQISDGIILTQRNLVPWQKLYTLSLKYSLGFDEIRSMLTVSNGVYCLQRDSGQVIEPLFSLGEGNRIHLEFADFEDGRLHFEGHVDTFLPLEQVEVQFVTEDVVTTANLFEREDKVHGVFFNDRLFASTGFSVWVPLREGKTEIEVRLSLCGVGVRPSLYDGKFFGLHFAKRFSYWLKQGFVISQSKKHHILIEREQSRVWLAKRELLHSSELMRSGMPKKYAAMRALAICNHLLKRSKREKWIMSDRIVKAGDNAEALFAHIEKLHRDDVDAKFIISHDVEDYARMKSFGPVLKYGTWKAQYEQLTADKIISSAADEYVINPFGKWGKYLKGLRHFDFVFLQHGVTKDDQSRWLNRFNKNISKLVVASEYENNSILDLPAYGYTRNELLCTGFPRFDKLRRPTLATREKRIAIMPTWREKLAGKFDVKSGKRFRNPAFTLSEYFKCYNDLLSSSELHSLLEKYGYVVDFIIHPAFIQEADNFSSSERVRILVKADYSEEFRSCSLFITDYSSAVFDAAFLGKPILYFQFDAETFYSGHIYKPGYFSYEDNGFGPVCTDRESLLKQLEYALSQDCRLDEQYAERRADFFGEVLNTRSYSEAVYQAIRS